MGIATNNLQSFRPYHPGELIKEESRIIEDFEKAQCSFRNN